MGYLTVESFEAEWLEDLGAHFTRVIDGQAWHRWVEPIGWVTIREAATLLTVSEALVGEWLRDERLDPNHVAAFPSGRAAIYLPVVRMIYEDRQQFGEVGPNYIGPRP